MESKPIGHRGIKYSDEIREKLFEQAFEDVLVNTGTPYPCTQTDIENLIGNSPPSRLDVIRMPTMSIEEATKKLEKHLENTTPKTEAFYESLNRLRGLLALKEGDCGPDLVVKSFHDWDQVIFRGKLKGRVIIRWAECEEDCDYVGCHYPRGEPFFYRWSEIEFNANAIFEEEYKYSFDPEKDAIYGPFGAMTSTLLHEMVHAYLYIMSGKDNTFREAFKMLTKRKIEGDGTFHTGHGTHFHRCAIAVDRATQSLLNGLRVTGCSCPDPRAERWFHTSYGRKAEG